MESKRSSHILHLFVFGSGLTALVYEVLWMRILVTHLGTTAYGVAVVLASFMGGMALGYFLFGLLVDRFELPPLALYGGMEFAIALCALCMPTVAGWVLSSAGILGGTTVTGIGADLGLRLTLAFAILLVPTVLMGGTLPVLCTARVRKSASVAVAAGGLYGWNTVGAALGCLVAAFVLIPSLGLRGSMWLCVGVNVAIALAAMLMSRGWERVSQQTAPRMQTSGRDRVVLAVAFLSGLTALAFEVLWTRILVMAIGGTVYAFATILAVMLAGLGLGALITARFVRQRGTTNGLGLLLALLSATLGTSLLLLGRLNALFLGLASGTSAGYGQVWAGQLMVCALVMLVPCILFGMIPPLAVGLLSHSGIGRGVGRVFGANAAGSVVGGILATFVLIPIIGIRESVTLLSLVLGLTGVAMLWIRKPIQFDLARMGALAGLAIPGLLFLLTPQWDGRQLAFGAGYRAKLLHGSKGQTSLRELTEQLELRFYRDGVTGTVSVTRRGKTSHLSVNGKGMASDTGPEARDHYLLGHLPMLLHPDPRQITLIGLGTGATLDALVQYDAKKITCIEIEPAVIEASRKCFSHISGSALADPRVRLVVDDARHYLDVVVRAPQDVIISQPFHPWVSGANNLYTAEFLRIVKRRLTDGGVFCLGFLFSEIQVSDLRVMARTFREVFPACSLWRPRQGGDLFFVGLKTSSLRLDASTILAGSLVKPVAKHLRSRGQMRSAHPMLASFMFGPSGMKAFGAGAPLNEDINPVLEFTTARHLFDGNDPFDALRALLEQKESVADYLDALSRTARQQLSRFEAAETLLAQLDLMALPPKSVVEEVYLKVWRLIPDDPLIRTRFAQTLAFNASQLIARHKVQQAQRKLERALEVQPDFALAHFQLGVLLYNRGQLRAALPHLEACGTKDDYAHALLMRFQIYFQQRQMARALETLRTYIKKRPDDPAGHNKLGIVHAASGRVSQAEASFRKALRLEPGYYEALSNLGILYCRSGRLAEGKTLIARSLGIQPHQPSVRRAVRDIGNE